MARGFYAAPTSHPNTRVQYLSQSGNVDAGADTGVDALTDNNTDNNDSADDSADSEYVENPRKRARVN